MYEEMRDGLVMHDDFVSHVCMILGPISPKFTFHFTVLILVFCTTIHMYLQVV